VPQPMSAGAEDQDGNGLVPISRALEPIHRCRARRHAVPPARFPDAARASPVSESPRDAGAAASLPFELRPRRLGERRVLEVVLHVPALPLGAAHAVFGELAQRSLHAAQTEPDVLRRVLGRKVTVLGELVEQRVLGRGRAPWIRNGQGALVGEPDAAVAISHKFGGGSGAGSDRLAREDAVRWGLESRTAYAAMLARLLQRLATTDDVDGRPMLEHTIVVHVKQMGVNHDAHRLLCLVAGGGALGVRGGRYLEVGSEGTPRYINDLWTTVCQSMGVRTEAFGDERYCTEPLRLS